MFRLKAREGSQKLSRAREARKCLACWWLKADALALSYSSAASTDSATDASNRGPPKAEEGRRARRQAMPGIQSKHIRPLGPERLRKGKSRKYNPLSTAVPFGTVTYFGELVSGSNR